MNLSKSQRRSVLLAAGMICSAGVLVFAISHSWRGHQQGGISGDAYFFDLNNNSLFVAPASSIPPIDSPSGPGPGGKPMGVRAYVYRCDDTHATLDGMTTEQVVQTGAYIGYLEKRTDAFKDYIAKAEHGVAPDPAVAARMVKQPNLICLPNDQRWVPDVSPEGQRILQSARSGCPGSAVVPCQP